MTIQRLIASGVALMWAPLVVSAEEGSPLFQNWLNLTINGEKVQTVSDVIFALVDLVAPVAVFVAGLVIIKAGFDMAMHGENDSERTKARNMLTNAVIGLAIILAAKALALAIQSTITSLK